MASENETVADIVRELRDDANAVLEDQHDEDCWTNIEASEIYRSLADRIEASHRREVAELRECLKETINAAADAMWWKRGCDKTRNVCTNCGEKDKTFPCPVKRWRKALEGGAK